MKQRVLITGSSGMLGVDLCKELTGDYELVGTDVVHGPRSTVNGFYECDITDREGIANVVAQVKPDIVIHAAAMTDVDGCELDPKKAYKINSEGTKNVTLACKESDAILIYMSTDFVFDGRKKTPYREEDKAAALSVYGDSKLQGERSIKRALKKYFIIRTSWLYGRGGKNFVDTILEEALRRKALKVVDDQVGSPTYTKDLAKAIGVLLNRILNTQYARLPEAHSTAVGQAILNTLYGTYHVSNSGSVSWYKYAKEILNLAESETKIIPISSKELARPAKRPAMSVLDNSKFIKFTGFRLRNWKDALTEYIKKARKDYAGKTKE